MKCFDKNDKTKEIIIHIQLQLCIQYTYAIIDSFNIPIIN